MGVLFRNIHSNFFGLEQISSSRPIKAETKDIYIDIPFKNGSLLIDDSSVFDKIVSVEFKIRKRTVEELFDTLLLVEQWLTTTARHELVFDDYPTKAYVGKVSSGIEFEKVLSTGRFIVSWRCLPEMITPTPLSLPTPSSFAYLWPEE